VAIVNGGSGATTAAGALTAFGLTSQGQSIVTASTPAQVLALLGITNSTFAETTVSTSQTLTSMSANTAYVATAALALTLPTAASAGNKFVIAAYGNGGAITLTPGNGTDTINGGAAGASYVLPESGGALVITDGASNWWTILGGDVAFNEIIAYGKGNNTATLQLSDTGSAGGAFLAMIGKNGSVFLQAGISTSQFLSIYDGASLLWHMDNSGNVQPAGSVNIAAGQNLRTGGGSGAVIYSGTGVPSAVDPVGSIYQRLDGGVGTHVYVSQGGGTWTPIAGV